MSALLRDRRTAREFAAALDAAAESSLDAELATLVALVASLRPAPLEPRAEFRGALRDTLVAEADQLSSRGGQPRRPAAERAEPLEPARHRARGLVAAGVAVSLLGGVGAAVASTHAVPGDALYGVKRGLENVQLSLARSDLSRGRELLEQADHRLSEAESLAASEDGHSSAGRARIAATLADLAAVTREGAEAMNAAYADSGDREPLVELDRFAIDQRERLDDLAAVLDPGLHGSVSGLVDQLTALQTRLDSLLQGSAAPAGTGPSDTALALASGQEPAGGQGGRRLVDQLGTVSADGSGAAGAPGGSDPLADLGSQVTGLVDGLTGGSGAGPGEGTGDGLGGLVSGLPVPGVSLPPLDGGGPTAAPTSQPAPLPTLPLPLPSVSVSVPGLPCLAVPPLTTC